MDTTCETVINNNVNFDNVKLNENEKKPGDSDTEDESSPVDKPKPNSSLFTKLLLNNKLTSIVINNFVDNSIKENNPKKSANDILKFYNFFSSKRTKKLTNEEIELRVDTITKIINEIMPVFVKEMLETYPDDKIIDIRIINEIQIHPNKPNVKYTMVINQV